MNEGMFFNPSEFVVLICKLEVIMITPTCKAEMRTECILVCTEPSTA